MRTALTKSLLVTALSVAGGFAHAEGFNFYALIDGGVANTSISHGGQSRTEFVTGGYAPNFMGLSAEKSLGSGLSGGFKLEQGFLLNGKTVFDQYGAFGPDSLFNRQANAWVKGDFGTVTLGTQSNIAFGSVLLGEPRAGSNFGSALATIDLDGGLGTVDQAAVSYKSPSMAGWTLAGTLVPDHGDAGSLKSGSRLAATYAGKDLGATLAVYEDKTQGAPSSKGTVAGASYKVGALTIKGLAVSQKTSVFTGLDTLGLGGAWALSPATTLDFGLYQSKDSAAHYKVATAAVGVQYKIVKDLTLYGQYASVQNKDSTPAAWNFAGPSSSYLTGSISQGQTASTVNVGLLYSFF